MPLCSVDFHPADSLDRRTPVVCSSAPVVALSLSVLLFVLTVCLSGCLNANINITRHRTGCCVNNNKLHYQFGRKRRRVDLLSTFDFVLFSPASPTSSDFFASKDILIEVSYFSECARRRLFKLPAGAALRALQLSHCCNNLSVTLELELEPANLAAN